MQFFISVNLTEIQLLCQTWKPYGRIAEAKIEKFSGMH